MIRAYRRSRIAVCVILLLSFLVVGLVWYQDRAYPLYIPIIASILTLGLGIVVAKLVGNILANMENTRYLGYLHMELDPKKFIEAYQDVPGRLPQGSYQAAVCSSYLADGYWADGAFSKALETLEGKLPEGNLALEGLYTGNRCAYYLAQGNLKQAEQAIRRLDEIVDACRLHKAELAGNLASIRTTTVSSQENSWMWRPFRTALPMLSTISGGWKLRRFWHRRSFGTISPRRPKKLWTISGRMAERPSSVFGQRKLPEIASHKSTSMDTKSPEPIGSGLAVFRITLRPGWQCARYPAGSCPRWWERPSSGPVRSCSWGR